METDLDKIEDGGVNWRKMLKDFYGPFAESVKSADIESLIGEAHDLSMLETERCPTCGGKTGSPRRILRPVPGVREPSEGLQVHAAATRRSQAGAAHG